MRTLMILVMVFCTLSFTACGQKTDVPTKVKKAFEQKVSNAKDVEWEYDSEDKLWEVEYEIGEDEFTSAFDENGKWVETEKEIKFAELPLPVKATIEADYSAYEVEEVEYLQTPDGKFYEVEVELEKDDEEVEFELLFSPDGKVVKKEQEKDDDDDEDDDNDEDDNDEDEDDD
jgi:predicted small lipoprotein YifL